VNEVAAIVDSAIAFPDLSPKLTEKLRRELSFPNPAYIQLLRQNKTPQTATPRRIDCLLELPSGHVEVPRGTVQIVRDTLRREDTAIKFTDERTKGRPLVEHSGKWRHMIRPYQRDALEQLKREVQGVVVIPPGGGKTFLGACAISAINRYSVVLAHTDDLVDQWIETVRDVLSLEPGVIRPGVIDLQPVTIASVFTLINVLREQPSLLANYGFMILDESHHAPARTFASLCAKIAARWRLGLTATPDRDDGLTKLVYWHFGKNLFEISAKTLIEQGYLLAPEVFAVETKFEFVYVGPDSKKNAALGRALEADNARAELIARNVARDAEKGEIILVLANRKKMCAKLDKLLAGLGVASIAITSKTSRKQRKEEIAKLRDGGRQVVIATSLADEGLNIPRLSRIHLAFPERAKGRTGQRIGRLMRPYDGKLPRMYDYVDRKVDTLKNRWLERRRVFRKIGLVVREDEPLLASV
jgi:superfamily II DNA or RNA helicase